MALLQRNAVLVNKQVQRFWQRITACQRSLTRPYLMAVHKHCNAAQEAGPAANDKTQHAYLQSTSDAVLHERHVQPFLQQIT